VEEAVEHYCEAATGDDTAALAEVLARASSFPPR
jgi:hypothetical protein